MLSSFNTQQQYQQQQQQQQQEADKKDGQEHDTSNCPQQHHIVSSSTQAKQLVISSAELIHRGDIAEARRVLSVLSAAVSPYGDASERLIHRFTRALSLRISPTSSVPNTTHQFHSSYLTFNQITPFLRFAHLTANQAILEALDGRRQIHILDLDTSHGVQWPPLLQAIADRSDRSDPPFIRITGTGNDLQMLRRTGDRLQTFAQSLGLKFQFHPLPIPSTSTTSNLIPAEFLLLPGETLAVNCMFFLHKLLSDFSISDINDGTQELRAFLRNVRALKPAVVTVGEREASHSSPMFLQRFLEALEYYTAIFESLEATLPPTSRERVVVEQAWLGREIEDIVGGDGGGRRERHQPLEQWETQMRGAGFKSCGLSPFALSQAKLLLRLHYPSEGYGIQMVRDSLLLGWRNKPLFSVSSWL